MSLTAYAEHEFELPEMGELEGELEGEMELEGEFEGELEGEFEGELEGELEGEMEMPELFGWGDVAGAARKGWNWLTTEGSPQRRIALSAAKGAIKGGSSLLGSRLGGETGKAIGDEVGSGLAGLLPDKELEFELEGEGESESAFHELELSPIRRIYPDAIMEHMAHEATEAESEAEAAEGFLPLIPMLAAKVLPTIASKVLPKIAGKVLPKIGGKILPRLAGRMLPRVTNVVNRVSPRLMRGVSNITRTLFRNRRTRPLVRTVPTIARRTMNRIAVQTAAGRPVSPQAAQRVLARQAATVLRNPHNVQTTLRRAHALDRCYHRISGTAAPAPMARQIAVQRRRRSCNHCGQVRRVACPSCGRV